MTGLRLAASLPVRAVSIALGVVTVAAVAFGVGFWMLADAVEGGE